MVKINRWTPLFLQPLQANIWTDKTRRTFYLSGPSMMIDVPGDIVKDFSIQAGPIVFSVVLKNGDELTSVETGDLEDEGEISYILIKDIWNGDDARRRVCDGSPAWPVPPPYPGIPGPYGPVGINPLFTPGYTFRPTRVSRGELIESGKSYLVSPQPVIGPPPLPPRYPYPNTPYAQNEQQVKQSYNTPSFMTDQFF